jgi:hypothetical protein
MGFIASNVHGIKRGAAGLTHLIGGVAHGYYESR